MMLLMQSFVSLDNLSSVYTTTQSTSPTLHLQTIPLSLVYSNYSLRTLHHRILPMLPTLLGFIYFSHTTRCASKLLNFVLALSSFDFLCIYRIYLFQHSLISFQIGAVHYNSFPLFCRLLLIMTYKTSLFFIVIYYLFPFVSYFFYYVYVFVRFGICLLPLFLIFLRTLFPIL
ncbi:putative membrane protein [Wolbachia endosymbiont of Drosophila ananassae]|nr:putative membrane protein [Wolbachia endosymbiont of Drosophila ananassae]